MHVSRNKCELIAECCITGVKPEYHAQPVQATIKGIDITKVLIFYKYLQAMYKLSVEDFENITQVFYRLLNNYDDECYLTINSVIAAINTELVLAKEELVVIRKNRELEEE